MHTLADPLERAYRCGRDRLAVVCGDTRYTYAAMWRRCRRLAGGLAALGLEPGDRVAILAANSSAYLEYYQAVPAAGMVIVPLNTRHAEPELRYALTDAGARVLLADRDVGGLAGVVERVIRIPEDYEALVADGPERALGAGVTEDSLAGLFYTGGTTGASKGVMLSHRNLVANTFHWMSLIAPRPEDVYLVMAPLFHAAGSLAVLACVWTAGVQVVVPAFDPALVLDCIEREGVTDTLAVPTMVAAMNEVQLASPRDVSSLRTLCHGGSPIATEVLRRAHAAFPRTELLHLYGATETAPLATGLRDEQSRLETERAHSCGQPLVGVEIRIVDAGGAELAPREVGEVAIRGPNVMLGYWNKPEQTAEVLRDGWYLSGDLGWVDEAGYLFLVDRKKDMIVSGGENVYSTEVEEVLYRHPDVLEAAVFGIPDEEWGELVFAVVVPRREVAVEALTAHCRRALAGYKVPKRIELRAQELPKSGPGKILKRELREPYWAGRERRIS